MARPPESRNRQWRTIWAAAARARRTLPIGNSSPPLHPRSARSSLLGGTCSTGAYGARSGPAPTREGRARRRPCPGRRATRPEPVGPRRRPGRPPVIAARMSVSPGRSNAARTTAPRRAGRMPGGRVRAAAALMVRGPSRDRSSRVGREPPGRPRARRRARSSASTPFRSTPDAEGTRSRRPPPPPRVSCVSPLCHPTDPISDLGPPRERTPGAPDEKRGGGYTGRDRRGMGVRCVAGTQKAPERGGSGAFLGGERRVPLPSGQGVVRPVCTR